MRSAIIAAVLAAACGGSSTQAPAKPPANHAEDPAVKTAQDPLAFLPVDADAVIGFDLKALRTSALWHDFQPAVQNVLQGIDSPAFRSCLGGSLDQLASVTLGFKASGADPTGVAVIHVADAPAMQNCLERELRTQQIVETVDRGVVVTKSDKTKAALGVVGGSTIVVHIDPAASADSLAAVTHAGVPLRGSQAFLGIYDHLERGASMWAVVNGNAKIFQSLASMGAKVRSVDGTIVVTDKVTLAGRMTVDSPDAATNLSNMVQPQLGQAKTMFDKLEVSAAGPVVRLDAVMTGDQLKQLLGLFGMH